jgi:hypothetical protein
MQAEIWRDIPGYEGAYQVSSLGRVRSMDRRIESKSKHGKSYTRFSAGRLISPSRAEKYAKIVLYPGNKSVLVHRLVASVFLGPCPEGQEVRHLNGDVTDNSVENLAYGSHKENEADKVRHGTRQVMCKLREETVRVIRDRIAAGETNIAIAKDYGVSDVTISNIRIGRCYGWVS